MVILSTVSRIAALFLGFALLYNAVLFTKADDGRVQNWLVDLWVKVEDVSTDKGRRAVALLNIIAASINKLLDSVFGARLLSALFILTSACLSISSLFLISTIRLGEHTFGRLWYMGLFIIASLMTTSVIETKSLKVATATVCSLLACLVWQSWFWSPGHSLSLLQYTSVIGGVAIGILLDAAFVAIIRKIIQQQEEEQSLMKILGTVSLNLVIGSALIAPSALFIMDSRPFFGAYEAHPVRFSLEWTMVIASTTNVLAALCALSMVAVSVAALAHRFIWSIAARLIHVCYDRKVVENRIFLFTLGSMLLSYSINWFSWLRNLPH
jgi:hypothetical protein